MKNPFEDDSTIVPSPQKKGEVDKEPPRDATLKDNQSWHSASPEEQKELQQVAKTFNEVAGDSFQKSQTPDQKGKDQPTLPGKEKSIGSDQELPLTLIASQPSIENDMTLAFVKKEVLPTEPTIINPHSQDAPYDPSQATVSPDQGQFSGHDTSSNSASFDPNQATVAPEQGQLSFDRTSRPGSAEQKPHQTENYLGPSTPAPESLGTFREKGFPQKVESRNWGKTNKENGESSKQENRTEVEGAPVKTDKAGRKLPSIPGYEIQGELGRGGMGVVYRAKQKGLGRMVALKMILGGANVSQADIERFELEARSVAALQHPSIVQVYEVGELEGIPYFSLEFIDGGALDSKLAGTPQPHKWCAEIMIQMARGMDFAHKQHIIHRDLKPQNILLTRDGVPKITDFGLAKKTDTDQSQTRSGSIMGTPSYMPPEQAEGRTKDLGPRSDIYSLGAILYEFLTGRPPFKGGTILDTLDQVRRREPVPPITLQPKTPIDLQTISLKCLEKDPAKRYATAGEMADDLTRYLKGEPIKARPVPWYVKVMKWSARNKTAAALIALAGFTAISLVLGSVWFSYLMKTEQERLNAERDEAQPKLLQASQLFEQKKFNEAEQLARDVINLIAYEPKLATMAQAATDLLEKINETQTAQASFESFKSHFDKALFYSAHVTGNITESREKVISSVQAALETYQINMDSKLPLSLPPMPLLEENQKEQVANGLFEMLIIMAQNLGLPSPGRDAKELKAGNEKALLLLDKIAQNEKFTPGYHRVMANVLMALDRPQDAQMELAKADMLKEKSATEWFLSGQFEYNQGNYETALDRFEKSQRANPDFLWANFFAGVCSIHLDRGHAALAHLSSCIEQNKGFAVFFLLRASTLSQILAKKTGLAKDAWQPVDEDFTTAEKLGVDPFMLFVNRGITFFERGNYELAIKDFAEAHKINPKDYRAPLNMGVLLRKNKKLLPAIEQFTLAVQLNPFDPKPFRERGYAHLELDKPEMAKAVADFQDSAKRRPNPKDRSEDLLALADIQYVTGNFRGCTALCKSVTDAEPDNFQAHLLMGRALVEEKKFPEAKDALDRFFATAPGDKLVGAGLKEEKPRLDLVRAYLARGIARTVVKDVNGALADFTKAAELDPENTQARTRRAKMILASWQNLAKEDFTTVLNNSTLSPDLQIEALLGRGYLLAKEGKTEEAEGDALAALRKKEPTINTLLNASGIFSIASARAEINSNTNSGLKPVVEKLRQEALGLLQKGMDKIPPPAQPGAWKNAIESDDSFDGIRGTPGYKALSQKYGNK